MNFNKLRNSRHYMYFAVPAGVLAFIGAGCGPNYSGNGNEFVVHGQVTDPGHHSLKARILEIDEAFGEADGWFKIGKVHQLHDNCDCHGFFDTNHRYGEVYDTYEQPISPSDVSVGACVKFVGKIRSNAEGKSWDDRPVYDTAEVEDCDPLPGAES